MLISGVVLFTNCKSKDDSIQIEDLNGIWNLKNVSGGLQGINIDYARGEVKWNFILESNTLIVENNIVSTGPADIYAGLDSGTYTIEIEQDGETSTLFINDVKRGVIIFLNDNLILDDGLDTDGFLTEFER